jgi:hypothetical protein
MAAAPPPLPPPQQHQLLVDWRGSTHCIDVVADAGAGGGAALLAQIGRAHV